MKNRYILIILVLVMAAAFTLGVTGAVSFEKEGSQDASAEGRDRMVGVLITNEHLDLFDYENFLNDNADKLFSGGEFTESEKAVYQGRIYAVLTDESYTNSETGKVTTTKRYVFEGIEGIAYFAARYTDGNDSYLGNHGDEAITNGHASFTTTDAGDSVELKGTIYVSVSKGPDTFFYNPIYQTPDGEVYAVTGQGVSYSGALVAGMSGTHSQKDEETVTVNGESETVGTYVEVSVCYMDTPTAALILQFDKDGRLIASQEYGPGEFPESIKAEPDTDYMVVETRMQSADGEGTVSRELFEPKDETLSAFYCREDGICVKRYCSIDW